MNFSKKRYLEALFLLSMVSVIIWLVYSTNQYISARHFAEQIVVTETEQFHPVRTTTRDDAPKVEVINEETDALSLDEIKIRIAKSNRERLILNQDYFDPLDNDSVVIVVQVHNRLIYLKHLIASLRESRGISKALLIFSHDFYDEHINDFIASIDFCKVMQIFYPYSIQTHPNIFPGPDSKDCPSNTAKNDAIKRGCLNAFYADKNGKYRNATLSQIKHHWWWKANQVFNLPDLKNYDGPVLFLEEDLYVSEDFISTLKLMLRTSKESCSYCKIMSLANNRDAVYFKLANFKHADKATITKQFSNMGLSFTRHTWSEMLSCTHSYCFFDDCNWDYSLQHLFTTCMKDTAAMTLNTPRVYHLGTCGTHFSNQNCDPSGAIADIKNMISQHPQELYPRTLMLVDRNHRNPSYTSYGGWGDPRDQSLCLGMTIT